MIIIGEKLGAFSKVTPSENFTGIMISMQLYPQNTCTVSYSNWSELLVNVDIRFYFILERANQDYVGGVTHNKILNIIRQCKKKQVIAWLIHPGNGMKYFQPEIQLVNKLGGLFILDHDKRGWNSDLRSFKGPPIQDYLNSYVYMGYPVRYTHDKYFKDKKKDWIFVPYGAWGDNRGGKESLAQARQIAEKYDLTILIPTWSFDIEEKHTDVRYVSSPEDWSRLLSHCKLCIDLQPLLTQGKVAAECAAVGTYYITSGKPFLAQEIWYNTNEDMDNIIRGNYDRVKYYQRALKHDISVTQSGIEEHFNG